MGPETRHPGGSGWLYLAIMGSTIALVTGLMTVTKVIGPASIPIWLGAMAGLVVVGVGPVGKAIGRRISGEPPQVTGTVEVPEELYAELDELRTRMQEMEERQEFAERLLAAPRSGDGRNEGGVS